MRQFLSFKWILTTVLVVIGVVVMVRLGFWQLDRLKWRQSFNEHYITQIKAPILDLNTNYQNDDLIDMEYRKIMVEGIYDFDHEVYLQNQVFENLPGYHVLTPLIINDGEAAVIINRGWIPLDYSEAEIKKIQPGGKQRVDGLIRLALNDTTFENGLGTLEADGSILFWKYINLEQLAKQIPYDIEPIYIEKENDQGMEYPIIAFKEIEITQGSHLGYAIQWFFFAALLGGGYPTFIRKNIGGSETNKGKTDGNNEKQ